MQLNKTKNSNPDHNRRLLGILDSFTCQDEFLVSRVSSYFGINRLSFISAVITALSSEVDTTVQKLGCTKIFCEGKQLFNQHTFETVLHGPL